MNFWIICMKLGDTENVRYLTENGTWTDVRSEARTFYDITSADRVADKYGGKVIRR